MNSTSTYNMRLDSCRRCGKELEVEQRCKTCNLPTTFNCHACGNITEKQFHPKCALLESTYMLNKK